MSFNEKYKKIKQLVQCELDIIERNLISQINIREPLNSYIKDFLTLPSKRIRLVLPLLYLKAHNQTVTSEQLWLLTVVELVHNASLIHDDVIDKSDFRRAHKTLSEEFDNKLAVISGDYILSIAVDILVKLNSIDIISKFSQTIKKMCIGEINQNFDRFKIGTIENYIEKTTNKTAYLFEIALTCTVMLAKTGIDIEHAGKFALDTGIAFQIRDDLINLTNTDSEKPADNDIKDGIYNAAVIYSGNPVDFDSGIEKTRDLLNNYIKSARKHLDNLVPNEYKSALIKLLELLNNE